MRSQRGSSECVFAMRPLRTGCAQDNTGRIIASAVSGSVGRPGSVEKGPLWIRYELASCLET